MWIEVSDVPAKGKLVTPGRNSQEEEHVGVVVDERKRKLDREGGILDLEVVVSRDKGVPREEDSNTKQEEEEPSQVVLGSVAEMDRKRSERKRRCQDQAGSEKRTVFR